MGRTTTPAGTARTTAGTAAALVGCALMMSGCGSGGATAPFAEPMAAHATSGDVDFAPGSITATLPSVRYVAGEHHMTFSHVAVAGRITGWEPGRATDWSTDAGRQVGWSDPADTREVLLMLRVGEVLAAGDGVGVAGGDEIGIVAMLPGDADADAAGEALVALDDVVVLAAHGPGARSGDWWIGLGGVLLGDLDDDGDITWPVLEAAGRDLAEVDDDADSLAALRIAAQNEASSVTVP